jgi:hypothetical protein
MADQPMADKRPGRSAFGLTCLLLVAIGYGAVVNVVPSLTGVALLDGTIGVALGLYICSHPASAAIDLLYLDRLVLQQLASEWADLGWLGLNLLVLIAGCLVTIVGATRFVG